MNWLTADERPATRDRKRGEAEAYGQAADLAGEFDGAEDECGSQTHAYADQQFCSTTSARPATSGRPPARRHGGGYQDGQEDAEATFE